MWTQHVAQIIYIKALETQRWGAGKISVSSLLLERQLTGDGWSQMAYNFSIVLYKNSRVQGQFQGIVWVNSHPGSSDIIHNFRSVLCLELIADKQRGGRDLLALTWGGGRMAYLSASMPLVHSCVKGVILLIPTWFQKPRSLKSRASNLILANYPFLLTWG